LGIIKDITNEKQLEEIIKVDTLTGVYSRNYFNDTVKKIYKEKKEVYLILIDLDDLRKINNVFGHVRGDEFAGITDISKNQLEITLKMIFEKINTLSLIPKLSISIGVGKIDLKNSFLTNYSEVDKILYKVKEDGKNNFEFRGELE
ncbi:MAG: GGDEF domain-containing protein, partial [Cetobacterium sp.]